MQKTALPRASTICLFLFVSLITGAMFVPSAMAAVQVGDNLYLIGDFRFRYEIDDQDRRDGRVDRSRDRARVRARFGFKYDWSKNVSFGLRLRTESDTAGGAGSTQSPHQTLGLLGTGSSGANEDFGLDRAYIEFKVLGNGFVWIGKHGMSLWQQNEAFWDGDIQPEGLGAGYKFKLGDTGSLTLQAVHTVLSEANWGSGTDLDSIFEDDMGTSAQAVYSRTMGSNTITVATGALFVADNGAKLLPGGSTTYSLHSIQWKNKSIFPKVPIKLGFDFLISSFDDSSPNTATATGSGVDDENIGFVANFAAKYNKWSFKVEHYYIEMNSVPLQGLLAQDDFPYSSNFFGQKYQIGYNFGKGMGIDFRVYSQEQILQDGPVLRGGGQAVLGSVGSGGPVQDDEHRNRYQVNLNIKF